MFHMKRTCTAPLEPDSEQRMEYLKDGIVWHKRSAMGRFAAPAALWRTTAGPRLSRRLIIRTNGCFVAAMRRAD